MASCVRRSPFKKDDAEGIGVDSACSPAMIVKNGPMPMACTAIELTRISTPADTNMVAWTEAMAPPAADCLMLDMYLRHRDEPIVAIIDQLALTWVK